MFEILYAIGWNQIVVAFVAAAVWLLCRTRDLRRRPAACHVLWLLVLLKVVTPSFVPVPLLPALAVRDAGEAAAFPEAAVSRIRDLGGGRVAEDDSSRIAPAPVRLPQANEPRFVPPEDVRLAPDAPAVAEDSDRSATFVAAALIVSLAATCLFWIVAFRRYLRTECLLEEEGAVRRIARQRF